METQVRFGSRFIEHLARMGFNHTNEPFYQQQYARRSAQLPASQIGGELKASPRYTTEGYLGFLATYYQERRVEDVQSAIRSDVKEQAKAAIFSLIGPFALVGAAIQATYDVVRGRHTAAKPKTK